MFLPQEMADALAAFTRWRQRHGRLVSVVRAAVTIRQMIDLALDPRAARVRVWLLMSARGRPRRGSRPRRGLMFPTLWRLSASSFAALGPPLRASHSRMSS